MIIRRKYLQFLNKVRALPRFIRIDFGIENGKMAKIRTYLSGKIRDLDDPVHSVIYGPSTTKLRDGGKIYMKPWTDFCI